MPSKYAAAFRLSIAALPILVVAACSNNSNTPTPTPITGVFLDSSVEGLDYVAGTGQKSATNAKGEFSCFIGDQVAFSIGGIALGSTSCTPVVTPVLLVPASDFRDDRVVNRMMALQLLDEDSDPANGIRLTSEVKTALANRAIDFNAAPTAFNTAMSGLLNTLSDKYKSRNVDTDRRTLSKEHYENTVASTLSLPFAEPVSQTNGAGAVSATVTRYQVQAANAFYIPYEGNIAAVKAEFPNGFLPSFGSGLAFKGTNANGELEFYGLTDRGPNGDGPNIPAITGTGTVGSKIFPSPSFTPAVGVITVGKNGAVLTSTLPIKVSASVNSSGLPLPEGTLGNSAETPVLDALKFDTSTKAVFNANGLDTEAIVVDRKRNVLWISDEYGPFIVKVDPTSGVILSKYAPGSGLPTLFSKRRANRGMEGLTLDVVADKLHGFLQSPLTDGNALYSVTNSQQRIERFARFTRWIEFDPVTESTTKSYAYPLNGADYLDGRTGNAKLGDVVSLGNGKFIVIEQGAAPSGKVFNKLMLLEIANATDIGTAAFNPTTSDLEKSSMAAAAVNGANWANVVPMRKTVLFDLNAAGWLAEKAEGLALVDANTLALSNDNDFGLKTNVFDANGVVVAGADITACNVTAAGVLITSTSLGCNAANNVRVARGEDRDRPSRLWLIKFSAPLASFSVPAGG